MKTYTIAASFCFVGLTFSAVADTFTLKDGTTLEGSVIKETDTSYVLEINVTKTIKDERTVEKTEVVKIEREKPDLTAFEEIKTLVPTPDLLTSAEYDNRIAMVEKFLTDYRASSKSREAKAILATLKEEANEVLAGAVKMNGVVVTPADYRANAYALDARVMEAKIRAVVQEGRYLVALRMFDRFSRDFRNSLAYADLIPLMELVITTYAGGIEQQLATYDRRLKERESGLELMAPEARSGTRNAIRDENNAVEKRFAEEKAAKVGWVTTHPFSKPTLDETLTYAKQELGRLATAKKAPVIEGGKFYREAFTAIRSNRDASTVTSAISAAKSAGVPASYMQTLETMARGAGIIP